MKIITDTSSLLSPAMGTELGLTVVPVGVAIDGKTFQDYTEITGEEFLDRVAAGGVPSSSQPAIGDMLDAMESSDEETLVLTVGDGLSGAYQTAMSARNLLEDSQRVHVLNSKTLAGALQHLVKKAVALKNAGLDICQINEQLCRGIESSRSFVIPEDFEFLRRSGRLTPLAARIGSSLKLLPVLTQTGDKTRITPVGVRRRWNSALEMVFQRLEQIEGGAGYKLFVCHGGAPQRAAEVLELVRQRFPAAETEALALSPALMTHGGPGCIVIQAITI